MNINPTLWSDTSFFLARSLSPLFVRDDVRVKKSIDRFPTGSFDIDQTNHQSDRGRIRQRRSHSGRQDQGICSHSPSLLSVEKSDHLLTISLQALAATHPFVRLIKGDGNCAWRGENYSTPPLPRAIKPVETYMWIVLSH